ncbi:hypothetical protein [Gottschalkia purinilytica]|uniref:hypothetical protein n=1 Tax=Gottschalkia purinilytica TaxID=1503 RepID=UPI0012FEECCD|nr:hypothetical protein [Gottschalkia purinilytica]
MFKSYADKLISFLICNGEASNEDYGIYLYEFETLIDFIVNTLVKLIIRLIFNKFS